MNAQDYENMKEFVIGLNDIQLHNLKEILTDEMQYRHPERNGN